MRKKEFKIKPEYIVRLIHSIGNCLASDKITVEGMSVGYMYRDYPLDDNDSGWRFISGTEDEDYLNNPDNMGIFDVNVIANYDKSITEYINLPIETKLQKVSGKNEFKILS